MFAIFSTIQTIGSFTLIPLIISLGFFFYNANSNQPTSLLGAISKGDVKVVKWYIEYEGIDPNAGWTADQNGNLLHLAAEANQSSVVEYLIYRCTDVRAMDEHKWTPLHYATVMDNVEMISMLLNAGARLQKDEHSRTPLHIAAMKDNSAVVETLLHSKAGHYAVGEIDLEGYKASDYASPQLQPLLVDAELASRAIKHKRKKRKKTKRLAAQRSTQNQA